ncbi:MAG: hypothetical protein H7232_17835 [Aeromicrobium sp.]|nr:hypothetical protein [Burkholderiales bacterium]
MTSNIKRQINLYAPTLLPTKESFTARGIVTGVVAALITMTGIGWWAVSERQSLARELASQTASRAAVAARTAELSGNAGGPPSPQELALREASLTTQRNAVATRRAVRDALRRGLANDKAGPSAMLKLLAASAPPQAWATDLRVSGGQFELIGKTLDPMAVNLWQARLVSMGAIAAQPSSTVKVERVESTAPASGRPTAVYSFNITATLAMALADDGGRP